MTDSVCVMKPTCRDHPFGESDWMTSLDVEDVLKSPHFQSAQSDCSED